MHVSSSRDTFGLYTSLQPRRRQVAFSGIDSEGSSESGSGGGAGVAVLLVGVGIGAVLVEIGVVTGTVSLVDSDCPVPPYREISAFLGSSLGVSSTVVCLPVVQGGMLRNSSKVRTRGLQHFQPARGVSYVRCM